MSISLKYITKLSANADTLMLTAEKDNQQSLPLSAEELKGLDEALKLKLKWVGFNEAGKKNWVIKVDAAKTTEAALENYRRAGAQACKELNKAKVAKVQLYCNNTETELNLAFLEGFILADYQFLKYFSDNNDRKNSLQSLSVLSTQFNKKACEELLHVTDAVMTARTLVNEPLSYLTAVQLSQDIAKLAKEAGFKFHYFDKKKIESLKMGGLLAVNRGSQLPPTFNILEWKPAKPLNKKPIVLVGKGVVYDTGGLSLKPTANSMDQMKSDMAGAAAVTGAFCALAKNKLNLHVIGLIPATDNRPGEDAYTPGDVVPMHNGMNVEVLNTDAEGRMILGDALSYAQQFNPELVIDLATLTGAAVAAIGPEGIVMMGTAAEKTKQRLKDSGNAVYERLVEFPMWDEYAAHIKSDIADIKNVGGPYAGAITAGKFLECFTKYDWIHLDIAGPSYIKADDHYRSKNGTGVGVRLLYHFLANYSA